MRLPFLFQAAHEAVSRPWCPRPGGVEVRGRFEGVLWAEGEILIGATGSVAGGVKGRDVCVQGRVEGKLHADRLVLIQGKAVVRADLSSRILVIERGATIACSCALGPATQQSACLEGAERAA